MCSVVSQTVLQVSVSEMNCNVEGVLKNVEGQFHQSLNKGILWYKNSTNMVKQKIPRVKERKVVRLGGKC